MGAFCTLNILVLKSSLKILLSVHLWFQYSKNALNCKESVEIFKICFCDVSNVTVNSKVLIVSGTPK